MEKRTAYRVGLFIGALLAGAGLLLILVLDGVGWLLGGVVGGPAGPVASTQVGLVPVVRNSQLDVDITYGAETTGIVRLIVTDAAGQTLWEVQGDGQTKPPTVTYGRVPTGWKQLVPSNAAPPPPASGRRVTVRADTRFQVTFGPGVEVNQVECDVPG